MIIKIESIKWAGNLSKLQRALKVYPENEQKCKDYYILLGGLVLGESSAITEYPNLTEAPSTTAPNAQNGAVAIEQPKVDITQPVSPFRCKNCEFVGKNDKSLALHFRKKHTK